jgi:hypothetical protein
MKSPLLYAGPGASFHPLRWEPYGCVWRVVTGKELANCIEAHGRIKWAGESTVGEIYELFLQHSNTSAFFWPHRVEVKVAPRVAFETERMRMRGFHLEFHGLSVVLSGPPREEPQIKREIEWFQPGALVSLQGANDAARDTFSEFRRRLSEYIEILTGLRQPGRVLENAPLIWMTAPTRHYKANAGPGSVVCANGTRDNCLSSGDHHEQRGAGIEWITQRTGQPPRFFGTLDRRRAFNAHAVREMRRAFGDVVEIVDYEAVTAALPSDFCIDGEHWGCTWPKWAPRARWPYQCHSLGAQTIANILANVLCNRFL